MNILQMALRRIAVRATEEQILNAGHKVTEAAKVPDNYVPQIPSVKSVFKSLFLSLLMIVGAMVFVGIISIFSFTAASVAGYVLAAGFIINGVIVGKTNDKISVPVQITDRRYSSGYRDGGFVDVENPNVFIEFTSFQRVLFFVENLFYSASIIVAVYFVGKIIEAFKS